jgi:hypothetical protein
MKTLALLLALLLVPVVAHAYTCNASGCTWNSGYTEPSTLTNGQPLTDLTGCTASYTVSVDGATAGAPKTFAIAASKPQGGGVISANNTDATMAAPHTYRVTETVACNSTAFGTGVPGAPATLLMNNGVTTSPATGLTIQ